jgi:hypothetical protein
MPTKKKFENQKEELFIQHKIENLFNNNIDLNLKRYNRK